MNNNFICGQYGEEKYRLKKYKYDEIPESIICTLKDLSNDLNCLLRGGLAYICISQDKRYILKDLDMLAHRSIMHDISEKLKDADIVYLNKNSFGNDVISAFWNGEDDYYKLDVLIVDELPEYEMHYLDDYEWKTVSTTFLLKNRLDKIAQKEIRHHSAEKTLNHYRVAKALMKFLRHDELLDYDDCDVRQIENVLQNLMDEIDVCGFIEELKQKTKR